MDFLKATKPLALVQRAPHQSQVEKNSNFKETVDLFTVYYFSTVIEEEPELLARLPFVFV